MWILQLSQSKCLIYEEKKVIQELALEIGGHTVRQTWANMFAMAPSVSLSTKLFSRRLSCLVEIS